MGTGKLLRCKECGHEWWQLQGCGLVGQRASTQRKKKATKLLCPKCNSSAIEETGQGLLWD